MDFGSVSGMMMMMMMMILLLNRYGHKPLSSLFSKADRIWIAGHAAFSVLFLICGDVFDHVQAFYDICALHPMTLAIMQPNMPAKNSRPNG